MTERIPRNFRVSQEKFIATFDFTDVASGTGYEVYYPMVYEDDINVLSPNVLFSQVVTQEALNVTSTTETVQLDVDYDILFNLPRVIKGKLLANIPMGVEANSGDTYNWWVHVYVRKWDGTTETAIADTQGKRFLGQVLTTSTFKHFMNAIEVDCPQTNFAKGESLRVTITMTGYSTAGDFNVFFGNDPLDRDTIDGEDTDWSNSSPTVPSTTKILVPYKLDL
jgi:hypothetical protein